MVDPHSAVGAEVLFRRKTLEPTESNGLDLEHQ